MSSEGSEAWIGLLFDGPMQSWGTDSRFQRRMTQGHPSKSAVIGMIAAAMGIDRELSERLEPLASLAMSTFLLPKRKHSIRLLDYHTVGGGYNKKTHPLRIPPKASGGPSDNAVVTTREYLTEARFGVLLCGKHDLISEVSKALADPQWGIWLGRKCCIPATPVLIGAFDSRGTTFSQLLLAAGLDTSLPETSFDRTEESQATMAEAHGVNDVPVRFNANNREFQMRYVQHKRAHSDSE